MKQRYNCDATQCRLNLVTQPFMVSWSRITSYLSIDIICLVICLPCKTEQGFWAEFSAHISACLRIPPIFRSFCAGPVLQGIYTSLLVTCTYIYPSANRQSAATTLPPGRPTLRWSRPRMASPRFGTETRTRAPAGAPWIPLTSVLTTRQGISQSSRILKRRHNVRLTQPSFPLCAASKARLNLFRGLNSM